MCVLVPASDVGTASDPSDCRRHSPASHDDRRLFEQPTMYTRYGVLLSSSFLNSCSAGFPVDPGKSSSRTGGSDISHCAFSATSAAVTRERITIDKERDVSDRNRPS